MTEIMPSVANTLMDTRNNLTGLATFTGATGLFRQLALCFGESLFLLAEEAWVLNELAVGQSRKGFQPYINTDGLIREWQVFGLDFLTEAGKPLSIDAASGTGFEFSPRLAVEFGLHLSDFSKADRAVTDLKTVVLREGNAVVLSFAFETRETRCLTFGDTVKERLECEFYPVNDILQDLTVNFFEFGMVFLPLWQVGLLNVPAYRDLGGVVLELPVIEQAVVNKTAGFESGF